MEYQQHYKPTTYNQPKADYFHPAALALGLLAGVGVLAVASCSRKSAKTIDDTVK